MLHRFASSFFFVIVSVSSTACGAASGPNVASTGSLSYSSSASTAAPPSTASLPFGDAPAPRRAAASPPTSIVVRPDALAVDFALRTVVDDPEVGVRVLAEAAKSLEGRFVEIVPRGSLAVRMRAMNIEPAPHASGKVVIRKESASRDAAREPVAVTMDGRIVVAMAPAQDYWERSHLLARMNAVADRIASKEAAEAAHAAITFGRIEPHVRAPDAMRAELARRWATQRKQGASEVQAGDVALAKDVCAPAAQVAVRVLSFEEIELTLPIECRRVE